MSRTIQPPTMHTKLVAASVSDMVQEWYQGKCEVPPMQVDTFEQRISRFQSDLTPPAADYVAGLGLKRIVEEIDGAMKHGTWRDEHGMRLKDTPEWVAFYNSLAARPASPDTRVVTDAMIVEIWKRAQQYDPDELFIELVRAIIGGQDRG